MSDFLGIDLVTLSMRLPIKVVNDLYDNAIDNDRRVATIVYELLKAYLAKTPTAPKFNDKQKRKVKNTA